jgi:dihydrofolate synthase/folylpolyglutamate synthase
LFLGSADLLPVEPLLYNQPMTYVQAIESLHALGAELAPEPHGSDFGSRRRRKFSLDPMRALAAALGNPERKFPSVLIAGTNGKGSTAAMLAGIAQAAGYRTGLYTSPHLDRPNERIQIGRIPISDEDFARLYFRACQAGERLVSEGALTERPSFFETITAMAFLYFAENAVDLAVLEVGIGGRLDATNIVEPLVSVITDISLDHMEWLGDTISAIAREKAGILRQNGVMVTLPQHPEANHALGEIAVSLNATGINAAEYMPPAHGGSRSDDRSASYPIVFDGVTVELHPPLAGSHQIRNTALAVAAARQLQARNGYSITPEAVAQGIAQTRWPGRLEFFPRTASHCAVLLDVAHNPAGVWSLRAALANYAEMEPAASPNAGSNTAARRTLLFGCMRDKAFEEMAQVLFPVFDRVIVVPVDSPRTASTGDLLAAAKRLGVDASSAASAHAGLELALRETPPEGLLVVAGSVYLIGALRGSLTSGFGKMVADAR